MLRCLCSRRFTSGYLLFTASPFYFDFSDSLFLLCDVLTLARHLESVDDGGRFDREVVVRGHRHNAAVRRTVKEADLNQIRFDHFLDRLAVLVDRGGYRSHTDRSAVEFIDDRQKQLAVNFIQTEPINLHCVQGTLRSRTRNPAVIEDLCKVSNTPQQAIGDTRCSA